MAEHFEVPGTQVVSVDTQGRVRKGPRRVDLPQYTKGYEDNDDDDDDDDSSSGRSVPAGLVSVRQVGAAISNMLQYATMTNMLQ